MSRITFGTDPEFFLSDKKGNLKSAIGVVPGKKSERYEMGGGHQCYYDNVLAECAIAPSNSAEVAVGHIGDCLQRLANLVEPYRLNLRASATFPANECLDEAAWEFACDPEFCAYELQVCNPPQCKKGNTFRSAGGHIHIGFTKGTNIEDNDDWNTAAHWLRIRVIRLCDLFIGVPSLLIDHDETSAARRKLYGGAGSHRPCFNYGVEYRALSNFWLGKPSLVRLMYNLCEFVVNQVNDDKDESTLKQFDSAEIRKTINSGDPEKGRVLYEKIKSYLPEDLVQEIAKHEKDKAKVNLYDSWGIKPKQV